jgi:hypothetical protein
MVSELPRAVDRGEIVDALTVNVEPNTLDLYAVGLFYLFFGIGEVAVDQESVATIHD